MPMSSKWSFSFIAFLINFRRDTIPVHHPSVPELMSIYRFLSFPDNPCMGSCVTVYIMPILLRWSGAQPPSLKTSPSPLFVIACSLYIGISAYKIWRSSPEAMPRREGPHLKWSVEKISYYRHTKSWCYCSSSSNSSSYSSSSSSSSSYDWVT